MAEQDPRRTNPRSAARSAARPARGSTRGNQPSPGARGHTSAPGAERAPANRAAADGCSVFFLDMGEERYGDSMVLLLGGRVVMIDGGHPQDFKSRWANHPSIPDQLAQILGGGPPFKLSLLVVTHAHSDHIGCLPTLVAQGIIRPERALVCDPDLGWGKTDDAGGADDAGVSDAARRMAAALREESRLTEQDDATLADFLQDVASLEANYRAMIERLVNDGVKVARFGVDDAETRAIVADLADIGMQVLGPSKEQLQTCARQIARSQRGARDGADEFLRTVAADAGSDAPSDDVQLYRILAAGYADAPDAAADGSAGPCINDQSIVLKFNYQGKALFFSGDMQLGEPQFSGVNDDMAGLRQTIAENAPYALVKFPHHGSYNGISDEIFTSFRSTFFGLCAGIGDQGHPSRQALHILDEHAGHVTWARTDKNGLVEFRATRDAWDVRVSAGSLNDDSPNTRSDAEPLVAHPPPSLPSEPLTPAEPAPPAPEDDPDTIEVIARVPKRATRVTVTVDLQPGGVTAPGPFPASRPHRAANDLSGPALNLAAGRKLPRLMFVTNAGALQRSVGNTGDVKPVLQALRAAGHVVVDDLPPGPATVAAAPARRRAAAERPAGVVILGGYDVVPPAVLDVLDPPLRQAIARNDDLDDFIVWSDDAYGDTDGDAFPELPVSRIPDGRDLTLLKAALSAPSGKGRRPWSGLRNLNRPFADAVWGRVAAGSSSLLTSHPTLWNQAPPLDLAGDRVYIMLHGSDVDGTRFWGELAGGRQIEAMNLSNLGATTPSVVFTGCCWGALAAKGIASRSDGAKPPPPRTAEESIALRYLKGGATAFVGCTGSHYSPEPPGGFFGGPMHTAFWKNVASGAAPAAALLAAKNEYRQGMPHGLTQPTGKAIEKKILWQYTCLGLGF